MNFSEIEAQTKNKSVRFDKEVINSNNKIKIDENSELWLEKYKPKKYDDLLTDEKTNRDILTWLKSWDELVFNKKVKVNLINENYQQKVQDKEKKFDFFAKNVNKPIISKNRINELELTYLKNKVILLAGPPGIGKTTLAKVLTIHSGYNPLIINASDERTPEKLFQRIFDSTQINNLNFSKTKGKPTCLILDEIDGALEGVEGKNSINGIIDFIKTGKIPGKFNKISYKIKEKSEKNTENFEENHDSDDNDDDGENKKFVNKDKQINKNSIKRPIICICNDLYAKALKPLRKEALVFNFKKGNANKLLLRLKDICSNEHIVIDTPTLRNLCQKSGLDIRLCVNTLQFISYNKKNMYFLNSLSKEQLSVLSNKDIGENIFETWTKIFTVNKDFKYNKIVNLYFSQDSMNTINEGIYTNYIKIPNKENEYQNRDKLLVKIY